jgi:hypothetical protein
VVAAARELEEAEREAAQRSATTGLPPGSPQVP